MKYQFIFTREGIQAGLSRHQSKHFNIYYDGNFVDNGYDREAQRFEESKSFYVTYQGCFVNVRLRGKEAKKAGKKW